jgi:UDP-3-O-[3-hydroxymyristoyl] glucosamine N-acyltransferase
MGFEVAEILEWTRGKIVNSGDLGNKIDQIKVNRLTSLKGAGREDLAFFFSRHYEKELMETSPGVLITGEAFVKPLQAAQLPIWKKSAIVACDDPYLAMAILSEKFSQPPKLNETQIHPTAIIHPSAQIGKSVWIGPRVVVEEGARVGQNSTIQAGCYIGKHSKMGENCTLYANVVIYENVTIGNRIRIHAGAVVGSDGFGYAPIRKDGNVVGHQKIYHLGTVVIGDDVELGANACVDRGTFGETRIDNHAKLDNMCHVGHNAHVEEGAIMCGGVFLAGNARIGKYAYIGGLTGVTNKVYIGDRAQVGAGSMMTKNVPADGTGVGNPQREYREHFRAHALLNKLVLERKNTKEEK